jgi:hypothetical protein
VFVRVDAGCRAGVFGSSMYSARSQRPSTAKSYFKLSAESDSSWSGGGAFDRSQLARTVGIAHSISHGVMAEGCNFVMCVALVL